jgi:hypothetical protein
MPMAVGISLIPSVISRRLDAQINQVIRNVVPGWAGVTNPLEVCRSAARLAGIDKLALGEEQEPVEKRDNVGLGLVNGEDDGPVKRLCQCLERFDDVVGVV